MTPFVRDLSELSMADVATVGGKNASLGEMLGALKPLGIAVPGGFAVTADAYWRVLEHGGLRARIADIVHGIAGRDVAERARRAAAVRALIEAAEIPADVWDPIAAAYARLVRDGGSESVAVRSSATAEDLPGASFAGQQESYLNVCGADALREAYRRCLASLFTERAVSYRVDQGFDAMQIGLSVGVQRMVR